MNKGLVVITGVVAALAMPFAAFAQSPTITAVDPAAKQLMVNWGASMQSGLFDFVGVIWPYAVGIALFFGAIFLMRKWVHI